MTIVRGQILKKKFKVLWVSCFDRFIFSLCPMGPRPESKRNKNKTRTKDS